MNNTLERFGYNITRQTMAQYNEASLRNCFLGAYGFKSKYEAESAAIEALKTFDGLPDMLLYAEVYRMNTDDNENLLIRQPLQTVTVIIHDPGRRYERAERFGDKLFPEIYSKALKEGNVQILSSDGSRKVFETTAL
ncbi:MAG: hypothetical protein J6I68_16980 [Butyrivibrio sp.]|uniref:hypothetical protein n=1 Tax=Butyrivibrio sp. TaxID=28121 RepID=UPI001B6D5315|nr:hypothetical protein [Butyrivibrio sp.]MBP3784932.1 hypothetical protein [Butyrivibrio sp.]